MTINEKEQKKLYGIWTECLKKLSSGAGADDVMPEVLRLLAQYCSSECAYVYEIDEKQKKLKLLWNWKKDTIKERECPAEEMDADILQSAENGVIHCCGQKNSPNFMGTLLEADNEVIGFLGIEKPHTASEEFFLKHMSYLIAEALNKKMMMHKLETAGSLDALTGLNNRSQYNHTLAKMERKPPVSLGTVFLDINGLKQANDEKGHHYGDHLLMCVGKILDDIFKEHAYRIGGDEFVVLLANVEKEEFKAMLEVLHKQIAQERELSVAVGSCYCSGTVNAQEQLKKADHLMYQNKLSYYEKM